MFKIQKIQKINPNPEQLKTYKSNKSVTRKRESKTKVLVCSDADLD